MRSPATLAMRRPAAVLPVKLILSTPGLRTRWSAASRCDGDQVQHARREADGLGGLGDDVGLERSFGRRLHDHGVARDERRRDLLRHDGVGRVPRRDGGDHADGFAQDERDAAQVTGRRLADPVVTLADVRVVRDRRGGRGHDEARESDQRAGLRDECIHQFGLAARELGGERAHQAGAIGDGHRRPGARVEGLAGCGHGGVHVGGAGLRDARGDLLGVRVHDLDAAAGRGGDPASTDEQGFRMLEADAVRQALLGHVFPRCTRDV